MSRAFRLTEEQYAALLKRQKRPPRPLERPRINAGLASVKRDVLAPEPSRPSKYRSRATGGYASVKEARRAAQLKLLQASGAIRVLREQVRYELIPKQEGERACALVVDFVYEELRDGSWNLVCEDTKGYKHGAAYALFVVKRKLLLQRYGIKVRET